MDEYAPTASLRGSEATRPYTSAEYRNNSADRSGVPGRAVLPVLRSWNIAD